MSKLWQSDTRSIRRINTTDIKAVFTNICSLVGLHFLSEGLFLLTSNAFSILLTPRQEQSLSGLSVNLLYWHVMNKRSAVNDNSLNQSQAFDLLIQIFSSIPLAQN